MAEHGLTEASCKEVENAEDAHKGFNTFEEIDPEVLKLMETVALLEADNARLLQLTSWGYRRAGNAYDRKPLVKPAVKALDVERTDPPHA